MSSVETVHTNAHDRTPECTLPSYISHPGIRYFYPEVRIWYNPFEIHIGELTVFSILFVRTLKFKFETILFKTDSTTNILANLIKQGLVPMGKKKSGMT